VDLGTRIKQALSLKKISQVELAAKLNIPLSTLNGYITERYIPDYEKLKDIAIAIDVSIDFLFGVDLEEALTNDELSIMARYRNFDEKQRVSALEYFRFLESQG
jgi:transcriptional regulator with XRE-family HTH domain